MNRWLFPLILSLLLTACFVDIPKEIVGYWEGETLKQDIAFDENGQVEIIDKKFSTYVGTYTITDGNVLTCDIDHSIFTKPVVRTVKIRGDKLILQEKQRQEVYHRR